MTVEAGNVMAIFGIFFRLESPTQTPAIAVLQALSGEIWGKTPRYGIEPTVQAYAGRLTARRGIEFTTEIEPHPIGSPFEARWYLTRTPGVELRRNDEEDYACIKAAVDNHQPA
jgi:hypothetical protein